MHNFFQEHFRPFSANEVAQNLKDFGKAALQKAIDKLVADEKLLEKCYGKQRVYCLMQDNTNTATINDDLLEIDRAINEVSINLKEAEEKFGVKDNELKNLQNQITLEKARIQAKQLTEEVGVFKDRLEKCSEIGTPISEEEKLRIYSEHDKYTKEYRKRKRICMDMVNAILEGYPKTKKDLFEEVGVETDEDVGFVLNIK